MQTTQFDSPLLCAKWRGWIYTWATHQESDLKTKTSRSHLKILEKLVEICADDSICPKRQFLWNGGSSSLLCAKWCPITVPATMAEAERGSSTAAAADPRADMTREVERRPAAGGEGFAAAGGFGHLGNLGQLLGHMYSWPFGPRTMGQQMHEYLARHAHGPTRPTDFSRHMPCYLLHSSERNAMHFYLF